MTCRRGNCTAEASRRQVILIRPDGSDGKQCGPYCDSHTDALLGNLKPTYLGGDPAYRIAVAGD